MGDETGLPVHELGGANDPAAECLPNGLVAEADSQDGDTSGKRLDHVQAYAGFTGCFRTRGDDDAFGRHALDFRDGNLIVATHREFGAEFAEGAYDVGGRSLYVTRGVGASMLPFRAFCRPEIVVFHVEAGR